MVSNYGPIGETPFDLRYDRRWISAALLGAIFWGFHVIVYVACLYLLWLRRQNERRRNGLLATCVTVLFIAGTTNFVTTSAQVELAFVDYKNWPEGPFIGWWENVANYSWWNTSQNIAYVIAEAIADALLLFRAWIIWERNYYIVAIPTLLYLVVVGLGIPWIFPSSRANVQMYEAWFACACSLNILLSLLIVARLLLHARAMRKALGAGSNVRYMSIVAIIVESGTLYAACNIFYIVAYVLPTAMGSIAWQILAQCVCISPELIILRVALGSIWHQTTADGTGAPSSLMFAGRSRGTESTGSTAFSDARRSRYSAAVQLQMLPKEKDPEIGEDAISEVGGVHLKEEISVGEV